jgi:hypothetical protein
VREACSRALERGPAQAANTRLGAIEDGETDKVV